MEEKTIEGRCISVDGTIKFDYYYGIEAEQFSFYRVPRLLIKDARFKELSSDAKLLYGLMLDRLALSIKNGWLDEENRVYIHLRWSSFFVTLTRKSFDIIMPAFFFQMVSYIHLMNGGCKKSCVYGF